MRFPSYSSALSWLYARNQFAMKMGLEKTRELLAALGNPEAGGTYLHVAGTNGKGSVCLALSRLLPVLGVKRVGLYTSPHLVSFRERIRVEDEPVPAAFVTEWLNRHIGTLEALNPTYFEIVTAMAFAWFRECGCEAVVLETGLGGRLDATNVVTPRVSVVTSIALDHVAMLGDTLEAVQREKLGIVKPGAPVVLDEARPALRRQAEEAARAAGVPLLNLADRFDEAAENGDNGPPRLPRLLRGAHRVYALPPGLRAEEYQMRNAALAVLALEAFHGAALPPEETWMPALRAARMPGRMQRLAPVSPEAHVPVLLDGAHNPAGAEALRAALARHPVGTRGVRTRVFFSMMGDKDASLLAFVRDLSRDLVFVDLSAVNPRALKPEELTRLFAGIPAPGARESAAPDARRASPSAPVDHRPNPGREDAHEARDPHVLRIVAPVREALEPLLRRGDGMEAAVFCGSLYLLGEVIPVLAPFYEGLEEFERLRREDEAGT